MTPLERLLSETSTHNHSRTSTGGARTATSTAARGGGFLVYEAFVPFSEFLVSSLPKFLGDSTKKKLAAEVIDSLIRLGEDFESVKRRATESQNFGEEIARILNSAAAQSAALEPEVANVQAGLIAADAVHFLKRPAEEDRGRLDARLREELAQFLKQREASEDGPGSDVAVANARAEEMLKVFVESGVSLVYLQHKLATEAEGEDAFTVLKERVKPSLYFSVRSLCNRIREFFKR